MQLKRELNEIVIKGKLPIAFFNSEVTEKKILCKSVKIKKHLNHKYKQRYHYAGFMGKLNSKMYDLL